MTSQPQFPVTTNWVSVTGGIGTIPRGSYGWSISVTSGQAWVGNVGPLIAGFYDSSQDRTLADINVRCSGAGHLAVLRFGAGPNI